MNIEYFMKRNIIKGIRCKGIRTANLTIPSEYVKILTKLKERIRTTRLKAAFGVNREMVMLYWDIGREILDRQRKSGWGGKITEMLSRDLRKEFPEMRGFSSRNLVYMRTFANEYPNREFTQQVVAQVPWGHITRLLDYVKDPDEREWYIQQTVTNGWSQTVLVHQIESGAYHRRGKAITNFDKTLPSTASDLAGQTLKDPYIFDFLGLGHEAQERDLERALVDHIRDFLLELGVGFAFVGSQYHMEIGGEDFYIDLLFYHLRLRCYIVVELKAGDLRPEFIGKMNFYLSAVDDLLRHPDDAPSLGLILCKTRNRVIAEYAMRDVQKPVGVSTYRIPDRVRMELPSRQMLETALGKELRHCSSDKSDRPPRKSRRKKGFKTGHM